MLRAVILTDSQRAVREAGAVLSKLRFREAAVAPGSHGLGSGASVAYAADNVTVEVVEVGWLSQIRGARNAPVLGSLVSLGRAAALGASVASVASRALFDAPPLPLDRFELAPGASGLLREVVLSSSGVEASASALCAEAREMWGATPKKPGVLRSGGVDFRVQPLSAGTTALVLRTDCVRAAYDDLKGAGVKVQKVGTSSMGSPGQVLVGLPWKGVEVRLCERREPTAQFHEAHSSIVDSPQVLPDLQNARVSGSLADNDAASPGVGEGDCWVEARSLLKQPHRLLYGPRT